jgi:hypothetical protein
VLPNFSGAPFVHLFRDADAPTAQIRAIKVHPNGLVYVCTPDGLIEFDGASWNTIPGTDRRMMNALDVDAAGRVWYSGPSMFGFLEPDERGVLRTHPLEQALPPELRDLGPVGKILVRGDGVYLGAVSRRLLLQVDAALTVRSIPVGEAFTFFECEGSLYVSTATRLQRLVAGRLEPAPADGQFPDGVFTSWPNAGGGTRLVNAHGLHLWRDGRATPVSAGLTALLDKDIVLCARPLADGLVALGTARHGVVLLHEDGRVLAHYGENEGLGFNGDTINEMDYDAEGGLWLAHPPNVIRLQVRTGAAVHHAAAGLRGITRTIALHRGRLHVGTTQGVFVHDPATGRFSPVPDAGTTVWTLLPTEDGLFIAGNDLRLLRDDGTTTVVDAYRTEFVSLARLKRDPDWIAASTAAGMRLYRRTGGQWAFAGRVPAVTDSVYNLVADETGWLWGARGWRELVRLDWRQGVRLDTRLERLGAEHGLGALADKATDLRLFLLGRQLEINNGRGQFRHLPERDHFEPETRIAGLEAGARWGRAFGQADGSIWFFEANSDTAGTGVARPGGPDRWRWERLPNTGLEPLNATAAVEDPSTHTVWINSRVLLSFDTRWRGARPGAPRPHLRRITGANREVLWGGAGQPHELVLDPTHNALQFAYAASSFHADIWGRMKTEYRTRLEGFDRDWSEWSGETKRAYTNLPSGSFAFQVQARDFPGRVSETAAVAFTITTPWWRTPLAFALWLPLAAGLVFLVVRLRTQALRRRAQQLEAQIAERTAELAASNAELSRLHRLELSEKNAARIAEDKAQLELLRYQLNPHFLFNALNSIYGLVYPHSRSAGELVRHLAEFCRSTFAHRGDQWHTCADELAMLRTYLDIEQARWRERLAVEFAPDPALAAHRLPAFLLLPVVENAVKHGGATSPDLLRIRVSSHRAATGDLVIEIANTGRWLAGQGTATVPSHGLGLENIRARLSKIFPGRHQLIVSVRDDWVTVTLQLPAP